MPQFDIYSFFTLVIWFYIAYSFYYLLALKFPLKNSSMCIKMREKVDGITLKFVKYLELNIFYNFTRSSFKN